jgi:hypothetical protein
MIAANVLMVTLIGCPTTKVLNRTEFWTAQDKNAKVTAENTCSREFNKCLKVFEKVEEGLYNATCGAKNGK